ncbi:hypothetical protein OG373_37265 [Streptomyces avidinii]|uniref:hypothetical protein n=1 Tax=Streptomyces avidinii TaxID=1895 RepID=UPI00386CE69F|nr:hypothetical protein OG373_37265 [Streptomyces avidinii]
MRATTGQCCGSGGRVLGHTIAGTDRVGDTGALEVALAGARHDAVTVPATRP